MQQVEHFETFLGDGAYDASGVYDAIFNKSPEAEVIVPPPKNATPGGSKHQQRNEHVDCIEEQGRMAWQKKTNYGMRALVELMMLRYKAIIGPKLKARQLPQQKTEAQVSVRLLNVMTSIGMPKSVKIN